MFRDEQRKVGVVRLLCGVFVTVSVYGDYTVGVFVDDFPFGIHTKGTNQIFVFSRAVNDLAFVQFVC